MKEHIEFLISSFLQNPSELTQQQTDELSGWILQDTENTKEFIRASIFRRCIHDILLNCDEERKYILQDDMNALDINAESFFDNRFWKGLLKDEQTADKVEIEKAPVLQQQSNEQVDRAKRVHKINKTTFFTSIISAAAMIALLVYLAVAPEVVNVEVATLTDSLDAQWAESPFTIGKNSRLTTNHTPLMLRKGYAELLFDNNSKIVIESPAEFQVISYDQIKLTYGRLYATVPHESIGFVVSTPNSKIIDLGTEFGVEVGINGSTELHVVKGKTSLVSGPNDNKTSVLVNANSAKKVEADSLASSDIVCNKKMFVRKIDSKDKFVWRGQNLNLADIVGGGDGFGSGEISQGIDVLTGEEINSMATTDVIAGREGYIPVASSSYIDGVFVPGISSEAAAINSLGGLVKEFPKTSGMIWGYIFNGAWHYSFDVPRHNLVLEGINLDGKKNPAIMMHSNLGITFDLSAIRKKIPTMKIQSFSSAFGISETVEKWLKPRDFSDLEQTPEVVKLATQRHASVEFWIFLDGKKVLQKKMSSNSQAENIEIPIDETVRFLTLAVTESDDTCMFDWSLFAHPELVLESSNK